MDMKELGNRVLSRLWHAQGPAKLWVYQLISPELDSNPVLRNRLFPIFFTCMIDTAEGNTDRSNELRRASKRLGHLSAEYYIDATEFLCNEALHLIEEFSDAEIVFLTEDRHQTTHGYLNEANKKNRVVRLPIDGRIQRVKLSSEEYWSRYRSVVEQHETAEKAIQHLRFKFCAARSLFWPTLNFTTMPQSKALIEFDIRHNRLPSLRIAQPKTNKQRVEVMLGLGMSLFDIRREGLIVEEPVLDPVTQYALLPERKQAED